MIRIILIFLSCIFLYIALMFKLWKEQLRYGEKHRDKISKQSIRCIREPGIRGKILSREFITIAGIKKDYDLLLHLSEMRKPGKISKTIDYVLSTIKAISDITGREINLSAERIRKHIQFEPALPIKIIESLSDEEIARISEIYPKIPGLEISQSYKRIYPHETFACHVLGHLGKEDMPPPEQREKFSYYIRDYIGKKGLEKIYDKSVASIDPSIGGLRASEGYSLVKVDTQGFVYENIEIVVPPQHGKNIVITINFFAQQFAEEILLNSKGAFVLLDASNGEVLAMASSPTFNPQLFVPSINPYDYQKLLQDPSRPFINRAINGVYTPGSIIKPLIALAALQAGIPPDEKIYCPGYANVGNQPIKCWRTSGHGELTVQEAIQHSCNVFFIEVSKIIGFDHIKQTLESAGIGEKTGLELNENSGLAPSKEYKLKTTGEKWTIFDTALISIGQGTILLTPLQAAVYMSAFANNGIAYKPHLIKAVYDHNGNLICEYNKKEVIIDLHANQEHIHIIKKGLYDVVNSEQGTAKKAASEKITVYGKTGTAEVNTKDGKIKNTWFAGFAENDQNTYAFALIIEEGISGGTTCAPKIKQFFNNWLD